MMSIDAALAMINSQDKQQQFLNMRAQIAAVCPKTLKALRLIDYDYHTPKRRHGFNLVKRENKKSGFVYYVRYSHNGKMLPTKWNTHTNVLFEAEAFALQNKERLISAYVSTHKTDSFSLLEKFYKKDSVYFLADAKRNHPLCESHRAEYERVILNKFLPYLQERNIRTLARIDHYVLHDFQDHLLAKGLKAHTVNGYFNALVRLFRYLALKGHISENPCNKVSSIPVQAGERRTHGCYEIEKLSGVFNEVWEDERLYLLCLLIYTSGLRNAEIKQIRLCDLIEMDGCRFIDVKASKTNNGIRLVPLHDFVYEKIKAYCGAKGENEPVFGTIQNSLFPAANLALAGKLAVPEKDLEAQNITFYSGRHFWKTMMNSEGLGDDIEEVFMGHSVSGTVAKLYNHKDKQGKKRMTEKARQVFSILDTCLFRNCPASFPQ